MARRIIFSPLTVNARDVTAMQTARIVKSVAALNHQIGYDALLVEEEIETPAAGTSLVWGPSPMAILIVR